MREVDRMSECILRIIDLRSRREKMIIRGRHAEREREKDVSIEMKWPNRRKRNR